VNRTISFVDVRTGAHMNTIEGSWLHVKSFHNPYNRMRDNITHLAHYMFAADCRSEKANRFTKFIGIAASMDWSATSTLDYSNVAK
jgi:hypothetical protein